MQELRQSFDKYYETINTIYELENLKKSILSDFVSAGRSMEPLVESLRKRHLSELERLGRRMDRVILGSVVFMMFVVLVTALRMMVTITRQLRAMQSYSHRVASGVLDAAPEGVFFGEFLKMENDIIAMVERLKENIYALRSEREKAIQQAQRAEAALKVKSDFLSAVSHELKTPLTSLLGFARLSEKKMKKWMAPLAGQDKEGRSHVDKLLANMRVMVEEGELLDKLIKNILDLIDLESEKTLWELAPFSLEEAADRAAAEHQDAARNKGLSLIVKSEPSLPKVLADEKWIERVLDNLISNAIKFSQHGAIECGLEKVDQGVMFTILDSGPGIPQDKLGEIFDRFTQIGDVNTGKPAGLGIGLAICREVIRGAGGRIWAESEPGQGGRFSFILPVAPGEKS